ncbi:hypothetical protein [Streptodolium elevatio]|uniref:Uncharacterized protein n=1 Tax=Streptodolium elevatio TaxID=3157996 RepID=A0ABV3DTW2_9ACTN
MSGRPGSGAPGEEPGAPKDEGLSIFGPLELPRDESGGYPAYDEYDGAGNHGQNPGYGGGYGDAGGTRIATPSMIVPPDPSQPPAPPPGYPAGPPPGYPAAPAAHGHPAPQAPQGWPGSPAPQYGPPQGPPHSGTPHSGPPQSGAPHSGPPADDPFASLFRPGPSAGPAPGPPAGSGYAQSGPPYVGPPPHVSGQPQYAAPAMPPRHHESAPGSGPGSPPGAARRRVIVGGSVAAVAVLLIAGLFASGAFDGGDKAKNTGGGSAAPTASGAAVPPPTTAPASPTATAKSQAQQMDELLDVSAGSRTKVAGAVAKIERCDDVDTAIRTLDDAAKQRDQQIQKLGALKTDQIPRGDELVEWLRKAWQASARADRSFAAWGRENAKGECEDGDRAKSTDDKRDANKASGEATTAKGKAVAIWNEAAEAAGLQPRKATEI